MSKFKVKDKVIILNKEDVYWGGCPSHHLIEKVVEIVEISERNIEIVDSDKDKWFFELNSKALKLYKKVKKVI